MLRAVSSIYIESQALELFSAYRRDVFKVFRAATLFSTAPSGQTVLSVETSSPRPAAPPPPPPPPPPGPAPPRRSWARPVAAAIALSASIGGGIYLYRKYDEDPKKKPLDTKERAADVWEPSPVPALASQLPAHVEYLVVGGGTAGFAALRALRAARPTERVLLAAREPYLPYMRPPLSKELWREPALAHRALSPDTLYFTQWNGKRRSVMYEPAAFYLPVDKLAAGQPGASVATGWSVTKLHVTEHKAELQDASGSQRAVVSYDKCLVAPGVRPRHVPALWGEGGAGAHGRVLRLRGLRDVRLLAQALEEGQRAAEARGDAGPTLALVGGGFLASELAAALGGELARRGGGVLQLFREPAALSHVLPAHLAAAASRRLLALGVELAAHTELVGSSVSPAGRVLLQTATGGVHEVDLVVECVGSELDEELAHNSQLELHPTLGGLVVNAELVARTDVWAAGDAACYHDVLLGRRRVEHHDHAVLSGRRAANNMAGQVEPYTHQSMFWSDLGPDLGFEAIGIIDSKLPTVSVFCDEAVTSNKAKAVTSQSAMAAATSLESPAEPQLSQSASLPVSQSASLPASEAEPQHYERGVVFYMREKRIVGILLWNLFNRMHIARQVMAQGEFEDLFEVAKLFAPQDEE